MRSVSNVQRLALRAWAVPIAVAVGTLWWPASLDSLERQNASTWGVDRALISQTISPPLSSGRFPLRISVNHKDIPHPSSIQYTIDSSLQNATAAVLDHYRPDYGVFVAIDPESGHLLAIASHQREGTPEHNLALRAGYPAASILRLLRPQRLSIWAKSKLTLSCRSMAKKRASTARTYCIIKTTNGLGTSH